jgi:hypothetical protein
MKSVLILSTCYDKVSFYMSRWAADLHQSLVKRDKTICMLHDAVTLCRSGTMLADALDQVEYVVFYGHGSQNELIALPGRANVQPAVKATPLVDVSTVAILKGKKVYAGCCSSLQGLGPAHMGAPGGAFVGYDQEFHFEFANESYFKDIVNQSVIAYVNGSSSQMVAADLRMAWTNLETGFSSGFLRHQPNASMAATTAGENAKRVGGLP